MLCMKTETRGRKPIKYFKIEAGQLKKFKLSDSQRLRYQAKKLGWKISTRILNGELLVFREF